MPRLSLQSLFSLLYLGTVVPLLLLLGGLVYYEYRSFLIAEHTSTMQELVHAGSDANGMIAGQSLALERLAALLVDQMEGSDFDVMVFDAEGRPLAASRGSNTWQSAAWNAGRNLSNARTEKISAGGESRVLYLLPLRNAEGQLRGSIAASFAVSAALSHMQPLTTWLLLTVAAVTLLALLIMPLLARLAARPVEDLARTARRVAGGDLDQRAELPAISELRDLAATLNSMLDQVQHTLALEQRTNSALRRFVADAAHELRSPLAVLRGSIEVWQMAQQQGDEAEIRQAAGIAEAEIESMGRLVDNLLLLARIEHADAQAATPLNIEEIDPLPLLEEVAERARLISQGQDIVLQWPEHELQPIRVDADLLRRALNNLLENAIRHTPPGKQIILTSRAEENGCTLSVQDEGCGIAAEHLPRIFDRFYQVDDVRTRRGSSGLGLPIVRAIIQAHDGHILVDSVPDQGTIMNLWLPCRGPQVYPRVDQRPALQAGQLERNGRTPPAAQPRPRPRPRLAGWLAPLALAGSGGLLMAALVSGIFLMLPSSADRIPDDSVAAVIVADEITATATPTAPPNPPLPTSTLPLPTGTPLPAPTTVPVLAQPQPAAGFDAAAAVARTYLGNGTVLEVTYLPERGPQVYEVLFSDRSEVYLDLAGGQILEFEQESGSDGPGTEGQRILEARLAAAVAQGAIVLSFDEAAAAAREYAADKGPPREVELEWWDEQVRAVYSIEFFDGPELLIDPADGALLEWEE
jgi:two-component system OmpR family sensor kinase